MQNEKDIQLLQLIYAAVLADATAQFAKENVLQNVTQRKKAEEMRCLGNSECGKEVCGRNHNV